MANNCYNYLEISGSKEDIQKLKKLILVKEDGKDVVKMDNIKPFKRGDNVYVIWGTKWFDVIDYDFNKTNAYISLDTAWSPCLPITLEMSRMFNLEIEHFYEEGGFDSEGDYNVDNGEVILDDGRKYSPQWHDCYKELNRDYMM